MLQRKCAGAYSTASTFTRCETERIMPRTASLSGRTASRCILRRPSAQMVRLCCLGRLMPLRMRVTFSFLAMALSRGDLFQGHPADLGDLLAAAQLLQGVDGGVDDVVGVGGPDALGEDVLDAGHLQDWAHGPAGD